MYFWYFYIYQFFLTIIILCSTIIPLPSHVLNSNTHFGQRLNEPTSKSFDPLLFRCIHRIMPWNQTIKAIIRNKINQFSLVALNLLYIYQCHGSRFYCRFEYLKMFPSLTTCTQLRTLRTGSYAPVWKYTNYRDIKCTFLLHVQCDHTTTDSTAVVSSNIPVVQESILKSWLSFYNLPCLKLHLNEFLTGHLVIFIFY